MVSSGLQIVALAITVTFPVISAVFIGLRLYSKRLSGTVGWDDRLVTIAWILTVAETYTSWMYIKTNFIGIHFDKIPPGEFGSKLANEYNFANQLLYNPILAIVKASVLVFLSRLNAQSTAIKRTIWGTFIINFALMIAIFVADIFQCSPLAYVYDTSIPGGKCFNQGAFFVATAALTIFTDLLVLFLPTWIIFGLQMPMRRKIAVIFILSLGLGVTVIGIIRMVLLIHAFFPNSADSNPDPTHDIGFVTSAVEVNIAIISSCGPALKPLLHRWTPHLLGTSYASRSRRNRSGYAYYNESNGHGGIRSGTHNSHMNRSRTRISTIQSYNDRDDFKSSGLHPHDPRYHQQEMELSTNISKKNRAPDSDSFSDESEIIGLASTTRQPDAEYGGIRKTTAVNITYDADPVKDDSTTLSRRDSRSESLTSMYVRPPPVAATRDERPLYPAQRGAEAEGWNRRQQRQGEEATSIGRQASVDSIV